MALKPKTRIAHLAGPTATIQNTPPLVTSNKARRKYGLPPRKNPDGTVPVFDGLRAQRLAAPAKVYVEQFSAHPLEADMAELYAPPDGYLGADGTLRKTRASKDDKAVYEIELHPDDGLYPMPYMAIQVDGNPWDEECAESRCTGGEGTAGLFSGWIAQFRGDRPLFDRGRRHGQSHFLAGDCRLLSRRPAERFHQRLARASAQRQGRRRHPAGDAGHALLSLQALSPGVGAAAAHARQGDERHAGSGLKRRL